MLAVETRDKYRVMSGVDIVDSFFHAHGFVLLSCYYMAVLYKRGNALCAHVSLHFNTIKFQLRTNCECIDFFTSKAPRTNCWQ